MEEGFSSSMKIDLDKLPIRRLDSIDELGNEQFPPDASHEEKRLSMIRKVDFSFVVENEAKKQKTATKSSKDTSTAPSWPWQGLVENLQLAHQELSVIIDLINTVEANDAVSVAGMQRPKQLPNEVLSDLAVCAATKFHRLRQLGKYFKESSKAMEQKVSKEGRFYSSLIRLQQNWKVKRQRLAAVVQGSEGFVFDLLDNVQSDMQSLLRPTSLSMVHIDRDAAGFLTIRRPEKSCRSLSIRLLGNYSCKQSKCTSYMQSPKDHPQSNKKQDLSSDELNSRVKETHSVLREIHQSVFVEQVFDMVNREVYNPISGINIAGMRKDLLHLTIGRDTSLCLNLMQSRKEYSSENIVLEENNPKERGSLVLPIMSKNNDVIHIEPLDAPKTFSLEAYLLQLFHDNVLMKSKEMVYTTQSHLLGQPASDSGGFLGHFCKTVAHRIFSNKVLLELEHLVTGVSYLDLLSHPTWHSRTSSWSISLKVPRSLLRDGRESTLSGNNDVKSGIKFDTKVVVKDEQITLNGGTASGTMGSFRAKSYDGCLMNSYGCDLEDLSVVLLQQIACQIIQWLHEEALIVGTKANRDFMSLHFDLDQGDTLSLVARIDPDDTDGFISWWLLMNAGSIIKGNPFNENQEPENRKFLGCLSLESLHAMLTELAGAYSIDGSC